MTERRRGEGSLFETYLFRILGTDQKLSVDAAPDSQPARGGNLAASP